MTYAQRLAQVWRICFLVQYFAEHHNRPAFGALGLWDWIWHFPRKFGASSAQVSRKYLARCGWKREAIKNVYKTNNNIYQTYKDWPVVI